MQIQLGEDAMPNQRTNNLQPLVSALGVEEDKVGQK